MQKVNIRITLQITDTNRYRSANVNATLNLTLGYSISSSLHTPGLILVLEGDLGEKASLN